MNILEIATVFFWSPLQCQKDLEQIIARTPLVMHSETFRVMRIFINDAISCDFVILYTNKKSVKFQGNMLNFCNFINKTTNKKSVKFQGDMLNFCDFIQIYLCIYHKSPP